MKKRLAACVLFWVIFLLFSLTGLVLVIAACLANGAELFLEKPSTSEGVKLAFNMLNDILLWTQQNGFSGALQHVSLPDVIQLECLNKKSLVLDVRNAMVRGQIFIEAGKIRNAARRKKGLGLRR